MNLRGETLRELEKVKKATSNKKIGPAFAGVFDKSTGKYYYALNSTNGMEPAKLHPLLKQRFSNVPQSVVDSYAYTKGFASHAEVYAVNEALLANPTASIDDLMVNVVRTGRDKLPAGAMFKRCPHCAFMLDGFEMISEVSKLGK